jgi:hypothetical protein
VETGGVFAKMDKKTYYVTVDIGPRSGEIRDYLELNDTHYDFEIEATPEEISRLQQMFEEVEDRDFVTFVKAHIPFLNNEAEESLAEDEKVRQIYRMIFELGTEETKQRMKESGLIY